MTDSSAHWDQLHGNPRFRPQYPNDHVVRFMLGSRSLLEKGRSRFLDIGVGAGRHCKLASDLGFETYGIDTSFVGLQHANQRLGKTDPGHLLARASMLALPFTDSSFKVVVSFGVFYYGTAVEMKRAIAEACRVLAPGGRAMIVSRTVDDYRFGKGEELGQNTFRLDITDTNEFEKVVHFLDEGDIEPYFAAFSRVTFEKTETSTANRTRLDSDWLITVEK